MLACVRLRHLIRMRELGFALLLRCLDAFSGSPSRSPHPQSCVALLVLLYQRAVERRSVCRYLMALAKAYVILWRRSHEFLPGSRRSLDGPLRPQRVVSLGIH